MAAAEDINKLIATVHELKMEVQSMNTELRTLTTSVEYVSSTNDKIEAQMKKIDNRLSDIDIVLTSSDQKYNDLLDKYNMLNEKIIAMESHSRRDNLLFNGIQEVPPGTVETQRDCIKKIQDVMKNRMNIPDVHLMRMARCHRLGKPPSANAGSRAQGRPRTILCKFHYFGDRQTVWDAKMKLKDTRISIQEDFPKEINDRRKKLLPIMFAAKRQGLKSYLAVDKLHVTDKANISSVYDVNTLHRLPPSLDSKFVSTVSKGDVFAFFGENCPLSNFHPAPFKTEGHTFRHVEEYLFFKKAEYAGDDASKKKILAASTPADCKQIGKGIRVDKTQWSPKEITIMTTALREKFSQNSDLRDFLLATEEKRLLEASPWDRFWGIGAGLKEVASSDPMKQWPGSNKLGLLLMDLRKMLK